MFEIISKEDAKSKNLKWYFTGRPCKKNHVCERLVSNRVCRECCNIKSNAWKNNNKEKVKSYSKAWSQNNLERLRERKRQYRLKNIEHYKEYEKRCRETRKDYTKAYNKKYREDNREYLLLQKANWKKENSNTINFINTNRRLAKKQRIPPWADMDIIKQMYSEAKHLTLTTGLQYHVDHIIPILGKTVSGLHVHTNLRVILATENLLKTNKLLPEFSDG